MVGPVGVSRWRRKRVARRRFATQHVANVDVVAWGSSGCLGRSTKKNPRSRISLPWGFSGEVTTVFEIQTETFRKRFIPSESEGDVLIQSSGRELVIRDRISPPLTCRLERLSRCFIHAMAHGMTTSRSMRLRLPRSRRPVPQQRDY